VKRLLAVLFAIILLTGCGTLKEILGFTEMAKDRPDLYYTAAYSLAGPNVGLFPKRRDSVVEADIETDQYGRELFTVWIPGFAFHDMTGGKDRNAFIPREVKVILQKHDEKKIYYYEDFCFLLESEDGFPTDKIDALKEKNDWGMPLREEKCSSRFYGGFFDELIDQWDYEKEKRIQDCFPGSLLKMVYPVVADKNGKILCGICTQLEETDLYKSYYVIYDPVIKSVDPEKGIMELTSLDYGQELHELKIRNGWDFTDCPDVGPQ
jgi:hypothetical protein